MSKIMHVRKKILDFSKAIDIINHGIFVRKLKFYNFSNCAILYIQFMSKANSNLFS